MLAVVEEQRKIDQTDMSRMREQLQLFQKEYVFYKDHSERMEIKSTTDVD